MGADTEQLSAPPLKRLADAAALATPVALLLTGCLYYAGYNEKANVNRHYGLSEAAITESFQQTLARGFVGSFITISGIVLSFYLLSRYVGRIMRWVDMRVLRMEIPIKNYQRIDKIPAVRVVLWGGAALYFSIAGLIAGKLQANERIYQFDQLLKHGCSKDCFVYVVKGHSIIGKVLDQDEHVTIVITTAGARLIQSGDLEFVRAFDPANDRGRIVAGDRFVKGARSKRPPATP